MIKPVVDTRKIRPEYGWRIRAGIRLKAKAGGALWRPLQAMAVTLAYKRIT